MVSVSKVIHAHKERSKKSFAPMYQGLTSGLLTGMGQYTATVPFATLTEAVAAELRQLRAARGLTQTDLAELSGIPRVSIQRYETGGSIKVEDLGRLCRALGEEPSDLFLRAEARVEGD